MIISKTPLRISFAGGGTDLPSFYKKNDYGAVFSSSINKYIYVSVKNHCELYNEKIRLNYSQTEQINDIKKIENPIIRRCLEFLKIDEPIYISTVADAPESSGLGSSSSFCVGLLNALYAFKGESISKARLAEEAAHIEIDLLERPIGKQDHYAAAIGGLNYIKFNSDDTTEIMPVSFKANITEAIFENLHTFWTGLERDASIILKEQNTNAIQNTDMLLKIRSQALEFFNLSKNKIFNLDTFGESLDHGWKMKCQLAFNISNDFIDNAYSKAKECGAIGGKISGAGNGGFLNLIIKESSVQIVRKKMLELGLVYFPISSDTEGTSIITLGT